MDQCSGVAPGGAATALPSPCRPRAPPVHRVTQSTPLYRLQSTRRNMTVGRTVETVEPRPGCGIGWLSVWPGKEDVRPSWRGVTHRAVNTPVHRCTGEVMASQCCDLSPSITHSVCLAQTKAASGEAWPPQWSAAGPPPPSNGFSIQSRQSKTAGRALLQHHQLANKTDPSSGVELNEHISTWNGTSILF